MLEIRIHGRGGQGNVMAAYLLASTAIDEGRQAQAFPSFGAERRGAPVTAFVRIADATIRRRCQVREPHFLIVQDPALLHVPGVTSGLRAGGAILADGAEEPGFDDRLGCAIVRLPATKLAVEHLGRPVPNTALMAAFLSLTGILPIDALIKALGNRFKGDVFERNKRLIEAAAGQVPAGLWQDIVKEVSMDATKRIALEGSQALARAVALCRPEVVAAYPITPQTHIVENLAKLVADGKLDAELVSVESEHSAASVALGAACAGSRAYTASSSQGIMLMAEVLFDISGLRVPVVMTCANRALSGPLSIWNDHQDAMAMRDSGWIQLYCADNQEAIDTTIQAYRIAERLEVPVMVCVGGFALTHTLEGLLMPTQEQVDGYLPAYHFSRSSNSTQPISVGTLVSPDHFTEARASHHNAIQAALFEIPAADADWESVSGRASGGLLEVRGDPEAKIGILTLGSVLGTLEDSMDAYPDLPCARLIKLRSFRPFPVEALRAACAGLDQLIVFERALSPGGGGIVAAEVKSALFGQAVRVVSFAAGLGGRDIGMEVYADLVAALDQPGDDLRFYGLKDNVMPEGGF